MKSEQDDADPVPFHSIPFHPIHFISSSISLFALSKTEFVASKFAHTIKRVNKRP